MSGRALRPKQTRFPTQFLRWEKPIANREALLRKGDWGFKVVGNFPKRFEREYHAISAASLQATQAKLIKLIREFSDSAEGGRTVKLWRNVFPHHVITKKPAETKMGKGKGNPAGFVAACKRGEIIFEWTNLPPRCGEHMIEKMRKICASALPLEIRLVKRPQFHPIVPLAVEEEMKRRKALRDSGEKPRPTYIPLGRNPTAAEEYIAELDPEEREELLESFTETGTLDRERFRNIKMDHLENMVFMRDVEDDEDE